MPLLLAQTPTGTVYQREDGSTFEVPQGLLGGAPAPLTPAPQVPQAAPPQPVDLGPGVDQLRSDLLGPVPPARSPFPVEDRGTSGYGSLVDQARSAFTGPGAGGQPTDLAEADRRVRAKELASYGKAAEGAMKPGNEDVGFVPSPKAGKLGDPYASIEQSLQDQGEIEARAAQDVAARRQTQVTEDAQAIAGLQATQKEASARLAATEQEIHGDVEALSAMKIDRNRLYKNMSTPRKLLAGASLFLGGFLEPQTGKNAALEIINRAIDQDLQTQMADRDNAREVIGQKTSLYGLMRQRYGDDIAAMHATRAVMLNHHALELEAMKAEYDSPLIIKRIDQAVGGVRLEAQKASDAAAQQKFENDTKRSQVGLGWANLGEEKRQFNAELGYKYTALDASQKEAEAKATATAAGATAKTQENPVYGYGGAIVGYAPDKETATKTREGVRAYRSYRTKLIELMRLQKEHGREFGGIAGYGQSEAYKRMLTLHTELLMQDKELKKLGVLQKLDLEQMAKSLGDGPKSWFGTDSTPKWEESLKIADDDFQTFMESEIGYDKRWDANPEGFLGGELPDEEKAREQQRAPVGLPTRSEAEQAAEDQRLLDAGEPVPKRPVKRTTPTMSDEDAGLLPSRRKRR